MVVKHDDVTVVLDIKNMSKEDIKGLLLDLPEDNCTAILDSLIDF
jgi:hypothetical protein